MKAAFVTNFCSHYRIKTFEILARYFDVDYFFYSAGNEWYWQKQHGVKQGNFKYQYLPGFTVGNTRITPTLPIKLLLGQYDVYIKCINGRFALPITYLIARLRRKPFILWTGIWMRLQTPAHRLFFPITRYLYRNADAVVVYGEHVKRYLIDEGVPANRIFVASHAVDNEFYSRTVSEDQRLLLRRSLGIGDDQKMVLYLGRLEESKGIAYLLQAYQKIVDNESVLVIAGDGNERQDLEELTKSLNICNNVRFLGYVPPIESLIYYAAADIFILPSITTPNGKEPWGLVINEALNQGIPVIASEAVGAAAGGLVIDGWNGIVVPEKNIRLLAAAITKVLTDNPLGSEMSKNALQSIANWDNEKMVWGFRQAIASVNNDKQQSNGQNN